MQEATKSTLVLGQQPKKQFTVEHSSGKEIEYKQMTSSGEYVRQLSDEQKEKEFNRIHQQYIKMKINRKAELMRLKREEFGTSSSDQQDSSSQQQIGEPKLGKKLQVKKSKGKSSQKSSFLSELNKFAVICQIKKLTSQTQLLFMDKDFEINKKIVSYHRINKLAVGLGEIGNQTCKKLRIGVTNEEEIALASSQSTSIKNKDKITDIFLHLISLKLNTKPNKTQQQTKPKKQQCGALSEGALICGKIFKKSQIIGTWQQRYIVIRSDGLHSYRNPNSKATMFIPITDIKQLQTQFQYHKEQLVVKLIYGNNTKTDFGVPVDSKMQWVGHFANLVQQ